MWWREETLEEQLDRVLTRKRNGLFLREERTDQENYDLGRLLLKRHGVRVHLAERGPFAGHFVEGADEEGTEEVLERAERAFEHADETLREFWSGLWSLAPRSALARHSGYLKRRERALQANGVFIDELERLRAKVEELEQQLAANRSTR